MLNTPSRPVAPPDPLIRSDRHPLDDLIEQALDEWQASPIDQRTEGAVIRATLADPQNREVIASWLVESGVVAQVEAPADFGPGGGSTAPVWLFPEHEDRFLRDPDEPETSLIKVVVEPTRVEAAPEWMAAEAGARPVFLIGGES